VLKSIFLVLPFLASPVFAAQLPTLIHCSGANGAELTIKLAPYEATIPIYQVSLNYQGRRYKSFEGALKVNTDKLFYVEASDSEQDGMILTAGYDLARNEGFYQMSANDGMSPLPPAYYSTCTLR
jgi:hypothetical protein